MEVMSSRTLTISLLDSPLDQPVTLPRDVQPRFTSFGCFYYKKVPSQVPPAHITKPFWSRPPPTRATQAWLERSQGDGYPAMATWQKARRQPLWLISSCLSLCTALCLGTAAAKGALPMLRVSEGIGALEASPAPAPSLPMSAKEAEETAGALYSAGRYEDALKAQSHSVLLHRQLVVQDPRQRPKLAASLHNLGVVLIRLGRKTEAIAPTEEALALYRAEIRDHGGEASQQAERPLRNLVLLYYEANRFQEALPMANELMELHQKVSHDLPMAQAEGVDVLNLRASLLVALNRPNEALADLEKAVAEGKSLNQRFPGNPGLQYGLAGSLTNLSQVADLLGMVDKALQPAQQAEALLRQVAGGQPQMMGDWAKALSRLGKAYSRLGRPTEARGPLEESIDLLRVLARGGPSGTLTVEVGGYRDDLAHTLESLAVVEQQSRHPRQAMAAGAEALAIYRALQQVDPLYGKDVERTQAWLISIPEFAPFRK